MRGPPGGDGRDRIADLRWSIRQRLALEPSTDSFDREELRQIDRRLREINEETDD